MKQVKGFLVLLLVGFFLMLFGLNNNSWATSQWAKKYEMPCQSCHTAFPRLTYMGEKFMRDGYQFDQDGNDKKKEISPRVFVDELQHLFGIRLNLRPVEYTTNGLDENGEKKNDFSFGRTNWLQFFVAGSIYKNTSIFIETEIDDSGKTHFSWYKMGFHNLFGPQGVANIVIGQQAPLEWMPASGRLRVMDGEQIAWGPRSSGNTGEEAIRLRGSRPGVSFYGSKGRVVYFAGISPGPKAGNGRDANNEINSWIGGRVEATGGSYEGSAVGLFALMGTDTADTATAQIKNDFTRYSLQGSLRRGGFDILAGYTFGKDDNWTVTTVTEEEQKFNALILQAAYLFGSNSQYYTALRWQNLDYDDETLAASTNEEQLAASIWYLPMENLKIGLNAQLDLEASGDEQEDKYYMTIRTMF